MLSLLGALWFHWWRAVQAKRMTSQKVEGLLPSDMTLFYLHMEPSCSSSIRSMEPWKTAIVFIDAFPWILRRLLNDRRGQWEVYPSTNLSHGPCFYPHFDSLSGSRCLCQLSRMGWHDMWNFQGCVDMTGMSAYVSNDFSSPFRLLDMDTNRLPKTMHVWLLHSSISFYISTRPRGHLPPARGPAFNVILEALGVAAESRSHDIGLFSTAASNWIRGTWDIQGPIAWQAQTKRWSPVARRPCPLFADYFVDSLYRRQW